MTTIAVRRALISVSDKTGLKGFARRLVAHGVEIVSSGGTASYLTDNGIPVTRVVDVTGAAEMLGGRVKTLHPKIHGAVLADLGDETHQRDLDREGIEPFQLVVLNLYPFESTVAGDPSPMEAVGQIDIGGPALIRAAAKNHAWVAVVVSPDRYDEVIREVESGGLTGPKRLELAREAFFRTASYDAAIVDWFERGEALPERAVFPVELIRELRYGENPHQAAGIYALRNAPAWWLAASQLQGKEMSFNNYVDAEAAWRLVTACDGPAAVIVKHTNPCGAALAEDLATAFERAWSGDPVAAFGGVVALNRPIDEATARLVVDHFIEVVVAPGAAAEAEAILTTRRNLRVLIAPPPATGDLDMQRVEGGMLLQERDPVPTRGDGPPDDWTVVGTEPVTDHQIADLRFAWSIAAATKSNAIVVVRDGVAVGVGAGDQSRVGAADRALHRAGDRARGAVAASDAFFPFRDGVDALADGGVGAVIQPGGSVRDDEVVAAANERGVVMVLTGRRHFKH